MDEIENKVCTGCGQLKPLGEFHRDGRGGHLGRCRTCRSATRKAWRGTYREKQAAYHRRFQLSRYGLTEGEYDAMLAAQGGGCAMCGEACPSGRQLAVDHDHESGRVRGLLCVNCNLGLGVYESIKDAAHAYLSECGAGNPHISHGSALAQQQKTRRVGTSVASARLADDDVRQIRRRYATEDVTQRTLAREYGVSQNAIGLILRRKTWLHVSDEDGVDAVVDPSHHINRLVDRVRRLTDEQIAEVRQLRGDGLSHRSIAARFGVHHTTITRLLTGEHWRVA